METKKVKSYLVSIVILGKGKISTKNKFVISENSSRKIKVFPIKNHRIKDIVVDGQNIKVVREDYQEIVLDNLKKDIEINIEFLELEKVTLSIVSNEGGRIIPSGEIKILKGSSFVVNIIPNKNHEINKVFLDRSEIVLDSPYLDLKKIQADTVLNVKFSTKKEIIEYYATKKRSVKK